MKWNSELFSYVINCYTVIGFPLLSKVFIDFVSFYPLVFMVFSRLQLARRMRFC